MDKIETKKVSRSDFLRTAGSTALYAALGIGFVSCGNSAGTDNNNIIDDSIDDENDTSPIQISNNGNTVTIDLSHNSVSRLKNSGEWLLITQANTLVVNVDGEVIRAFTSVCTHQGCNTNWKFQDSLFECTCHGSRFNTSGAVVRGPANQDLDEFDVSISGIELTINKN